MTDEEKGSFTSAEVWVVLTVLITLPLFTVVGSIITGLKLAFIIPAVVVMGALLTAVLAYRSRWRRRAIRDARMNQFIVDARASMDETRARRDRPESGSARRGHGGRGER